MRVVNNKVNIARGETASYVLKVKYSDTNEPYHLYDSTGNSVFIGVFTVKDTVNNNENAVQLWDDLNSRGYVFKNETVTPLKQGNIRVDFDDYTPSDADLGILYVDLSNNYGYYTKTDTGYKLNVGYEFELNFPLAHSNTAVLEPKRYAYDINILQGNWAEGVNPDTATVADFIVVSKYVLIEPTDFIVGGSLSG